MIDWYARYKGGVVNDIQGIMTSWRINGVMLSNISFNHIIHSWFDNIFLILSERRGSGWLKRQKNVDELKIKNMISKEIEFIRVKLSSMVRAVTKLG